MSLLQQLQERSNNSCELCKGEESLTVYILPPETNQVFEKSVLLCNTCTTAIDNLESIDVNHWRCLNDSMWSEHKPVQILTWRILNTIKNEGWPQDLLDMMYLEDEDLVFAKAGIHDENKLIHKDSNGNVLTQGDSVVLIKDLDVKGSSLVAKRGTAVRNIRLDNENAEYIEGKVDGQHIVILTKYVKKV